MEGCPDFFEYLDERAYDLLDEDERQSYERDEKDKRQRYVKRDAQGHKQINPRYDKGNDAKSKQAHEEAVTRYLLTQDASTVRVIPALDCVGVFSRGRSISQLIDDLTKDDAIRVAAALGERVPWPRRAIRPPDPWRFIIQAIVAEALEAS